MGGLVATASSNATAGDASARCLWQVHVSMSECFKAMFLSLDPVDYLATSGDGAVSVHAALMPC